MDSTRTGLDLSKNLFQVHGVDRKGRVIIRRQLLRKQVAGFFEQLPPCLVGMEACGGSRIIGRGFCSKGVTRYG